LWIWMVDASLGTNGLAIHKSSCEIKAIWTNSKLNSPWNPEILSHFIICSRCKWTHGYVVCHDCMRLWGNFWQFFLNNLSLTPKATLSECWGYVWHYEHWGLNQQRFWSDLEDRILNFFKLFTCSKNYYKEFLIGVSFKNEN